MKNNYTLLYTSCRCKYAKICIYYAGKWKFKRCLSPDKTRENDMIKILFICHSNIRIALIIRNPVDLSVSRVS